MSTTVDERVVEMRFDNKDFESNVQTSLSTLDKLKTGLNLTDASKGLENVGNAAKGIDMSGLSSAVETVHSRFSALEVVAITTLSNITNSVINTGKRMLRSLTIEPISEGFSEYELKMDSVQTIMASTGADLDTVMDKLNELNTYADKTIYSFSDMTTNIGKFTNAGVELNDAVAAIQGVANVAAVSGANANEASRAMYNFAQALSAGYVKLIDWKSIENANMATVEFKTQLLDAAVAAGTLEKTSDGMYKVLTTNANGASMSDTISATQNFNDSLAYQWMTTEVLTNTLGDYADETTEIGKKAFAAAQDVKTFTQLMDTLKEAVGSGWAETWEILFGNYDEAKELWTSVSNTVGGFIDAQSKARNALLQEWKDLGGRTDLIEAFKNALSGVASIVHPIKEGFEEIFSPITSQQLADFTGKLRDFTANLKLSDENADKLKRTFKGVFSILDLFKKGLSLVGQAVSNLLGSEGIASLGSLLLSITAGIGDFFTSLNEGIEMDGISGALAGITSGISDMLKSVTGDINSFGDLFKATGQTISDVIATIWNALSEVFTWITDHVSLGNILTGLNIGNAFLFAKGLVSVFGKVKDTLDSIKDIFGSKSGASSIKENFADVLDAVHESLESFTSGIKSASLLAIAGAIGILSASLKSISELKPADIAKSLTSMASMMTMLNLSFRSISKTLSKFSTKDIVKSSASLILISEAIKLLADAMTKMADLSLTEIIKGLGAVGGMIAELSAGLKLLDGTKVSLTTSVAILALAESCKILGNALAQFGALSWNEITRGLTGMAGALTELVVTLGVLGKIGGGSSLLSSASVLLIVQSLGKMADGLKKIGEMTWSEIGRGLTGMAGALTELAAISGVLGALAPLAGLGGGALLLSVQGLGDLADAFQKFGQMSWDEVSRGLAAMSTALTAIAAGGLANTFSGFGAKSISKIAEPIGTLADSLQKWKDVTIPDDIDTQLDALAGGVMKFTLVGAGADALSTAAPALGIMADSVSKWADVTVPEGLDSQLSALADGVSSFTFILGADSLSAAAPAIGDMATAVKKWADITIPTGLKDGLQGIAEGVKSFSFAFVSGWSLSAVTEPLSSLADSIKKWNSLTIPEDIADKLRSLADGINAFASTFIGGWSIGQVTEPLKTLADAVKKWNGIRVPDKIADELTDLANGVRSFTGIGDISYTASSIDIIASALSKLSGVKFESLNSGLSGFITSVNGLGSTSGSFSELSNSITSVLSTIRASASAFQSAGKLLSSRLAEGIKMNASAIYSNLVNAVKQAANGARNYYSTFYSAGSYMVTGFANGISANSYRAAAKSKAMASAAASAAKAALKEHSPSKVFYGIGDYAGQGFVNALGDYAAKSQKAGAKMAESATTGLSGAISKLANVVNSDLNTEPTIRPVLDLSSVQSGIGTMNDMLGNSSGHSIGGFTLLSPVLRNANQIASLSEQSRLEVFGRDEKLLGAISKIGDKVSAVSGNSYTINGITYDDGSNITEAVKTLIRAARVERRA